MLPPADNYCIPLRYKAPAAKPGLAHFRIGSPFVPASSSPVQEQKRSTKRAFSLIWLRQERRKLFRRRRSPRSTRSSRSTRTSAWSLLVLLVLLELLGLLL